MQQQQHVSDKLILLCHWQSASVTMHAELLIIEVTAEPLSLVLCRLTKSEMLRFYSILEQRWLWSGGML